MTANIREKLIKCIGGHTTDTHWTHEGLADAVLNMLMDVDPNHEAMIAEAIAAEFDLVLSEMKNSEFMDFIAAAQAARLALLRA